MASIHALRRTASPPLSEGRRALADAIGADQEAQERATALEAALRQVREEVNAASESVSAAKEQVKIAAERGYEHVVNRIVGRPAPGVPSRFHAAATMAEAEAALEDAVAAGRAISSEVDALRSGERGWADKIREAAEAVLKDEVGDKVAGLIEEANKAHRALIDAGRALSWLRARGVVRAHTADATPGIEAAFAAFERAARDSQRWLDAAASPTEGRMAAAFAALQRDASAPLP